MYTEDDPRWSEGAREARGFYPPRIALVDLDPDHRPSDSEPKIGKDHQEHPRVGLKVRAHGYLVFHELTADRQSGRIDWGLSLVTDQEAQFD